MSQVTTVVELSVTDLTEQGETYCPNPKAGMQLWNTHPRVFLDVGKTGSAKCPYCGQLYRLKAGEVFQHSH
ncbi:hypothetical protein CUZ56_02791 [Saezia sanguinis]|uniref:Zinc finger CHCC-type domain-containing protein n=1 Tax=Saezia sanguinis TaxID=1965230 RepID=A0A433SAF2_9BURK|nr:zinc-finger domain-containing protein [Saezia sanguinis]RUS65705.1 hypothetical protein CUZ56_02791 [Saezia sanguinis]